MTDTVPSKRRRKRIRQHLYRRQSGLCHWCRKVMSLHRNHDDTMPANYATFEHLKRKRDGGTFAKGNIVLACRRCNNEREHGIDTNALLQKKKLERQDACT